MKKITIAIIACILVLIVIVHFLPSTKITTHNLITSKEYYMCAEQNGEWLKKDEFNRKDEISVCFTISSIENWDTYPIAYRVYKIDTNNEIQEVLNMYNEVPKVENRIQLKLEFEPGKYLLKVYCIRTLLFSLSFVVL